MMWSISVEDLVVERDHPFGVELAERDLQPAAVAGDFVDAVQFEVEQFPDPQPAGALQPQRGRGQLVARAARSALG